MTDENIGRTVALQDYQHQSAEAMARLQYQIDYSKALLGGLTVANGGAILALLTFIGNTGSKVHPQSMKDAFTVYGAGLAAVLIAYGCAFATQGFFYHVSQKQAWNAQMEALGVKGDNDFEDDAVKAGRSLAGAVIAATISLICFAWASIAALEALS